MRPLGTGRVTVGIIVLLNALALPATIGVSSVAVVLWIVGGTLLVGGVAVRRRGKPTVKEELRLRQLEDLREKQPISRPRRSSHGSSSSYGIRSRQLKIDARGSLPFESRR
jgi:hypothetical protein